MSEKNIFIYDELMAKFLAGECSALEEAELFSWIEADATHKRRFEAFKTIWDESPDEEDSHQFNADNAWDRVRLQTIEKRQTKIFSLWQKAAVWLFIIAASVVAYFQFKSGTKTIVTDFVAVKTVDSLYLSDTTWVALRKGSTLSYPQQFSKRERRVTLKGEAFFKVKHNPAKPFRITAGNTEIEVLGTSFNVQETDSLVVVYVSTGSVRVTANNQSVTLKPGEKALVKKNRAPFIQITEDENDISYLTGTVSFNNQKLSTVIRQLNRQYNVSIAVSQPGINDCSITTTFKNETIEQVLTIISATLNLTWTADGNEYLLKGEGCK